MERVFMFCLVLVVLDALMSVEGQEIIQGTCNSTHDRQRTELIDKSNCGDPKEVLVEMHVAESYREISPSSVWVKRCVGICDYDLPGTQCKALKFRLEAVPVRIYDVNKKEDICTTYGVEVHEECACCTGPGDLCPKAEKEEEVESI